MGITADCAASPDTDALLAQARAGDPQAFCQLAAQHEQRLLQQAFGLARQANTAEDLVAETFVEAWRSLPRYDATCRLSTWLFAILLHRHQKYLRHARSRPIPLANLPTGAAREHQAAQENLPATTPSPADQVLRQETAEQVRQAIATLPEKHQQILLLRFFEEASLPEIAALLGCSLGTVKSRLHYALEKLRASQQALNLSELWRDTSI